MGIPDVLSQGCTLWFNLNELHTALKISSFPSTQLSQIMCAKEKRDALEFLSFKENKHKSFWLISANCSCCTRETVTSMLPAYKCSQPVKGFILVSARTVFLAPGVHFPLLAPVTLNNAKPFKFWIEVIPRCSEIIWDFLLFPTKAPKWWEKNCMTQEGEHLMLPLGWDMACFLCHVLAIWKHCKSIAMWYDEHTPAAWEGLE